MLANVVNGAVNVLMTIVAIRLLDRTGRRPLLLGGTTGMAAGMIVVALTFAIGGSQLHGGAAYLAIAGLLLYTGSFAIGLGPVFWLLISEIYPVKIRGQAMSVATMANNDFVDHHLLPDPAERHRQRSCSCSPPCRSSRSPTSSGRCPRPRTAACLTSNAASTSPRGTPGQDGTLNMVTVRTPSRVPDRPCVDCLDPSPAADTWPGRSPPGGVLAGGVGTGRGMLGTTLPTPLYVVYQAQWHFSSAIVTVTFAVYAAAVMATLLLAGRSSDQAGRKPVLAVALGASALSTVVFILAPDVGALIAGRIVPGYRRAW